MKSVKYAEESSLVTILSLPILSSMMVCRYFEIVKIEEMISVREALSISKPIGWSKNLEKSSTISLRKEAILVKNSPRNQVNFPSNPFYSFSGSFSSSSFILSIYSFHYAEILKVSSKKKLSFDFSSFLPITSSLVYEMILRISSIKIEERYDDLIFYVK